MFSQPDGSYNLRPHEQHGSSGVIPKVMINYFEISTISRISKEQCRASCEVIFKYISDQVRKGVNLQVDIPMVGRILVRNMTAAIKFNQELVQKSKGQTARSYTVNNLFSSANNSHNLNMYKTCLSVKKGTMAITDAALDWLKENLSINVDKLPKDPE